MNTPDLETSLAAAAYALHRLEAGADPNVLVGEVGLVFDIPIVDKTGEIEQLSQTLVNAARASLDEAAQQV